MTDHATTWETYFEEYAAAWKERLMLGHWEICYSLTNGVINNNPDVLGLCTPERQLGHSANIEFVDRLSEIPDKKREWYIIHELMHIKTDELCHYAEMHLPEEQREYFGRLVEVMVSDLADVAVNVYRHGRKSILPDAGDSPDVCTADPEGKTVDVA